MAKTEREASQKEQIKEQNSPGHLRLDEDKEQFAALRHLTLTGVKLNTRDGVPRGQGAFGTVYKAEYNGVPCAAKQVDPIKLRKYLGKQYFIQECLLHSRLKHKNIVKMLGVYMHDESEWPVLVMELMEYGTLSQLTLNDEELFIPTYVKLSILQDVSEGLVYLHTMNPPILHCDLTPYNILLTADLIAKLADFGEAAKMERGHPRSHGWNKLIGWSRHCKFGDGDDSRWQLDRESGDDHYTPSSEVFSFGCIACHIITQKWGRINSWQVGLHRNLFETISVPNGFQSPLYRCQNYIHEISEGPVKQLIESCLVHNQERRPSIIIVYEAITDIVTKYYSNNVNVKKAYSMALKKGQAWFKDAQVQVVGAENSGKTSLISSFLDEEFIEQQAATAGADVGACKVYSKNWTRSGNGEKINHLSNEFVQYFRGNAFKYMIVQNIMKPEQKSSNQEFVNLSNSLIMEHKTVSNKTIVISHNNDTVDGLQESNIQTSDEEQVTMQHDLMVVFWDFAGQAIFHNSHSAFISDSSVIMITFNASLKLSDNIITHDGSHQPPECQTVISSIHYWLQVVHSVCSVKENVLLVGTHIDKLHSDIDKAREIAKMRILPELHKELVDKAYAAHLTNFIFFPSIYGKSLEKCCFFVSNKFRDGEILCLKSEAMRIARNIQRKQQPIYFLKIEQALMQQTEPVISKSMMLDLVTKCTFTLAKNSAEFEGTLRYFHNKRTILHFNQIESLKDIVILSPHWLAKLFSYIIAADNDTFIIGNDLNIKRAWERLHKFGILNESLLQCMLNKFHSDYPSVVKLTKQQVVDILFCFHLLACITKEVAPEEANVWFIEEGHTPISGNTFIVPYLLPQHDDKIIPNTDQERIVYFKFGSGFVPANLLHHVIADCICRNVKQNNHLFWMRYGKVRLQLGGHQIYYISQCEEYQSIQLTITVVGFDTKSAQERKELIDDISQLLDDIMKLFMPAIKERPTILFRCPLCTILHITQKDVCSGEAIYCANGPKGVCVPPEYYNNLLPTKPGSLLGILTQTPDMHKLNKIVIPRIQSKWKNVAYSMRYQIHDVDAIEKECNHVLRDCCQHLFSKWLTTRHHPTWRKLLDYIKGVDDLVAAAEEIEKKLVSDMDMDSCRTDSSHMDSSHKDSSLRSNYPSKQMPGEVMKAGYLANCPLSFHKNYKCGLCDHNGGVLTSKCGDLKLTIPEGAIRYGDCVTFCMVTNLYGPFVIPSKCPTDVVSPYYWIGAARSCYFQKPIQVEFEHYAVVTACDPSHYQLLCCEDDDESYTMQPVDCNLSFKEEDDISWCIFETGHLCSYCLLHGCRDPKISRVTAIFLKKENFQYLNHFTAEIWFSFSINYCIKRNKELYTNEGMVLDPKGSYNFKISCEESSTSYFTLVYHQDVNGWHLKHSRSTQIMTKDINFYNCYVSMEELQANEEISLFPQRFIVNVTKEFDCNMDLDTSIVVTLQNEGKTIESIPFVLFVSVSTAVKSIISNLKSKKPLPLIDEHQCNEKKPELKELIKYSSRISTCWKEIALHLKISEDKISVIEVNNLIDVNNRCYDMFKTWLQSSITPPCWCHFAQALYTVGLHRTAEEVITIHLKQHLDSMNVAASSALSSILIENGDACNLVENDDNHILIENEDTCIHTETQTPAYNQCRIV